MSSLIFYTDATQTLVATDTLAVHPGGQPHHFTTKAFFLPHLRMLIAGTGVAGFLDAWHLILNTRMAVRDVLHVDPFAPNLLKGIWARLKEGTKLSDRTTTTVYHFGYSGGAMRTFAYRSTNDFGSESLPYGLATKPPCTVPENYSLPTDIKSMMEDQRRMQSGVSKDERLYIGGEIQIHHLLESGCQIYTLDRFEDCEAQRAAIEGQQNS
jgi:hypothetical protein